MERKIEKKDNFISIQAAEGEEVEIKVNGDSPLIFIMPYDGNLNLYVKREHIPIQFKDK